MKNEGFTLIELLAVIVILAIIALIAVPIILNIIEGTKVSTDKRSIDLYGKAVENAIANYQIINTSDSDITLEKIKPYIEYKGNEVKCGVYIHDDGSVFLEGCSVNGKKVDYTYGVDTLTFKKVQEENKTLAGSIPQGNFEPGDEYVINVDGKNNYHFYVLNTEEDKVNLIMSRNICSDGTLATENNTCLVAWYIDAEDNSNGPITSFDYLSQATKNWINIKNAQIDYTDEGNHYGTIKTSGNTTTITKKDGTVTGTYENLKARLITNSEIVTAGCNSSTGSCPAWMINGLLSFDSYYPSHVKENIKDVYGYWSLSSYSADTSGAFCVTYRGQRDANTVIRAKHRGIRPVITVSKLDLS